MARKGRPRRRRLADAVARSHPSLQDPGRLIVLGRVSVDGRVVDNPASLVRDDAVITIRRERPLRGEAKLTAALEQFQVPVAGRTALDLGAAAGGFTRVLLREGAAKVYAVDVGYGQLLGSLRQDPRVVVLERTKVAVLDESLVPDAIELVTVDVSYLSLGEAVSQLGDRVTLDADADLIALVKPQFELRLSRPPGAAADLKAALAHATAGVERAGWTVQAAASSPVQGSRGRSSSFSMHASAVDPGLSPGPAKGLHVAPTQDALYAEIDLDLSWSEKDLPERERTRHVHRLHPYLGKFIPQLVEALLARYVRRGGRVLDPFAGSGTTLVQALESGYDAVGVDLAAFNCLLMEVKTRRYDLFRLESEIRDVVRQVERLKPGDACVDGYLGRWFAPRALGQLLAFHELAADYEHADVLRVVLARAARSARLTTHFDLDFPRAPQIGEYWCHKHKRICRPVDRAEHFLRRYALDTLARIKEFTRVRARKHEALVVHGDSRDVELAGRFDALVTSPPYPGLIDYHEQHRYAYELLGLDDLRDRELGAAAQGASREALSAYVNGIAEALRRAKSSLRGRGPVVVVVNDRRNLYPEILERAGLRLEERLRRHVNRRTGRRAGEFFEDVLVAR